MNIKNLTEEQLRKAAGIQNYIDQVADIEYACYLEKITYKQFWDRYLWKKVE